MEENSSVKIPMNTSVRMDMDADGKAVDETRYKALIGSLLYLTTSRPDIPFAVVVCARFQSAPKESHMTAAKIILRYLKDTMNQDIEFKKENNCKLVGYTYNDWVGSVDDRKSTSFYIFCLRTNIISWSSKKQKSIALSSARVEYIAGTDAACEVIW
ncbi:hypothetical protein DH2020_007977 [Rehmannia glutinosa]|uniref:Mitochondrial protein n=1 Tax=Rehmannia glutinosa TaxID=99300 RepID=A0ABR0TZP5_REHGL